MVNKTKEQRRKTMQSIKSQSQLENRVSKALWHKGFRFRKNSKDLYGKPDISIKKYKLVIFVDSCFWHYCPLHGHRPKSNIKYWDNKLKKNKERDYKVNKYYSTRGWHVKRIWEHEIKHDFEKTIEETVEFILKAKKQK
ncbi:very short patch repair endonuclease [Shouchella clausii]|uniref:very short patch repair endonuclease n=1 Tax=Shouchella clausii TaxID=79880 RepID=UPI000BA5230D|nr:very short patch repair endonuclease [Shouchella clausii]PAE96833.1 very short patch repair endonuclease [Shouchella clausii]PAF09632.1 very short patch repair endonuclease [Shouchella clausii]